MYIARRLKKRLVLLNNIFNHKEFFLYDRGIILEPDFECDCYFPPDCLNNFMQYYNLRSCIILEGSLNYEMFKVLNTALLTARNQMPSCIYYSLHYNH